MKKILAVIISCTIMLCCTGCAKAEPIGNTATASTAVEFVKSMGMGWNLGNTLDPYNCGSNDLAYETSWGNTTTRRDLITFIKSEGFDTIRIPVTWGDHAGDAPDYIIREEWFARVQEIVDWCVEEDLYIIIKLY